MVGRPQDVVLNLYGKFLDEAINNIPKIYPAVLIEHYVIMPDHFHILLTVCADENGQPMIAPTMSTVIQQLKGYVTKKIGKSIWQKLFVDHIIRNQKDFEEHMTYIEENPIRWHYDKIEND